MKSARRNKDDCVTRKSIISSGWISAQVSNLDFSSLIQFSWFVKFSMHEFSCTEGFRKLFDRLFAAKFCHFFHTVL